MPKVPELASKAAAATREKDFVEFNKSFSQMLTAQLEQAMSAKSKNDD